MHRLIMLFSGAPVDPNGFQEVLEHGWHLKNPDCMAALIQAEGEDDGLAPWCHHWRPIQKSKKNPCYLLKMITFFASLLSDADNDFSSKSGSDSDSDSETLGLDSDINVVEKITNEEVHIPEIPLKLLIYVLFYQLASILPTKTIPPPGSCSDPNVWCLQKKGSSKAKIRKHAPSPTSVPPTQPPLKKARVEEPEIEDDVAGSLGELTMPTAVTDPGPSALGMSNWTKTMVNLQIIITNLN